MTIVVGGYIVGYPLGGMTWHHLNYLLSLQALGHDVWFLEDSGSWLVPFNPVTNICEPDPSYGIEYLKQTFSAVGLEPKYCYYSEFQDTYHGLSKSALSELLRRADLLLCVSGITPLRDDRPRPRRTCVIDTDPVFTQLRMRHDADFIAYYKSFDAVATFGTLIGTPACSLPTHGFNWIGTNQPVSLPHWPVLPRSSSSFGTLGKWEHSSERHFEFNGERFLSSKGIEWIKLIELPAKTSFELRLSMASLPVETQHRFSQSGWHFGDATAASISAATFGDFVRHLAGELTVAKQIYAALPSGWFSDRSACFLATGRPVVTQESGFSEWLPAGEGLFSFRSVDEASAALQQISSNYLRHAASARNIAEKFFDGQRVLKNLIDRIT